MKTVLPSVFRLGAEAVPLSGLALALLCALYLLAGLTGHDPWKNDDAIHFGVVYGFLRDGNWLVPQLAGESFLEMPPLYYWVAAICARLTGWFLPLHDAVRLASGLFGALFLGLLAFAGRVLHHMEYAERREQRAAGKNESGQAAALIAIGCLGLLVPIHDTQPLVALLAASAATYAGLALLPRRAIAGGLLVGLGLGLGFLASGLTALITLAPLALLLPLHAHWRSASSLRGLAIAVAVALPLGASWPLLLAWQAPHALNAWWSLALAGVRYQSGWLHAVSYLELLAWFAWPALPLAVWAVWLNRQRLSQPSMVLPLAGTLIALLTLLLLSEPRPLQALPLLVPLILLAAGSAGRLRRGATNAFDWFGMMTFTLVAGLIWLGGIAMISGIPAQIERNFAKLAPGFVPHFSPLAYALAALLSLAWLVLIVARPRSPWRAINNWAAGLTLMWVLLMALWLPWIDYGKSYRGVAASIKQEFSENPSHPEPRTGRECIAGRNLGSALRVSLQYFAGIATQRAGTTAATACSMLLEQSYSTSKVSPPGWRKVWEGHRPGDRSEVLRFYRRD
ncbi:MAG: glycosyltransferase family 39 protein [Sterolibacterium sp.]|nr:glycosyltransferase family 39 protein [Sterolibacterium sp.]